MPGLTAKICETVIILVMLVMQFFIRMVERIVNPTKVYEYQSFLAVGVVGVAVIWFLLFYNRLVISKRKEKLISIPVFLHCIATALIIISSTTQAYLIVFEVSGHEKWGFIPFFITFFIFFGKLVELRVSFECMPRIGWLLLHLISIPPLSLLSSDRFGGSLDMEGVLDFVDSGHVLILAADANASDLIPKIAAEYGADFDEDPFAIVVDHTSYAVSETEGDHILIVADDFIQSDVILGKKKIEAPVLFNGIGHSLNPGNSMILKTLSASSSSYSTNPSSKLSGLAPSLYGSAISLVPVVQEFSDKMKRNRA